MAGSTKYKAEIILQINIPVAIFHGKENQLINASYLNKLNIPTLWKNKIHFIREAGHLAQWENPEMFTELLIQFLEEK